MNITSITGYTPIRQVQKVNFGAVKVSPEMKRLCDLSDDDVSMLNNKCPKNLDIYVFYLSSSKASINTFYKGTREQVSEPVVFDILLYEDHFDRINVENKTRCITAFDKVIDNYNEKRFKKGI